MCEQASLLFCIDKSSLGVSHIGVATPWDDCPYAQSNANTFVRARAYRVFLTSCVGINLGNIPWGQRHPLMSPRLNPLHSVIKHYTNTLRLCIVTLHQLPMSVEGVPVFVERPHGREGELQLELASAVHEVPLLQLGEQHELSAPVR